MPAISSIIAGVAATAAIGGTAVSIAGSSRAASAQAAASNSQAIAGAYQAAGTDIQGQALGVQKEQQELQIATQRKAIVLQQQQDDLRRQATNLDASRRTREAVRQGISARAQSLTAATNQGAADKGSTALGGAEGSISGRTGNNLMGIFQNLQIGNSISDLNRSISSNYLNAQDRNAELVSQSYNYQRILLAYQKEVYKQGSSANLNYRDAAAAGSISAFGSGLTSLGGALVKNQEPLTNLTNNFIGSFGGGSNASTGFGLSGEQVTGIPGSAGAIY